MSRASDRLLALANTYERATAIAEDPMLLEEVLNEVLLMTDQRDGLLAACEAALSACEAALSEWDGDSGALDYSIGKLHDAVAKARGPR